jgi:long-chain-fatty-acid--[acyl-carrier-protein] ligase
VDPTLITLAIWKKYPIRPVIVEYMYYMPLIHTVMRLMNALPIPNFVTSSNSLKKKRADKVLETMIEDLKHKENFLIYPAGKTKHQAREVIGASGVHRIIQAVPEVNVVLVHTTGLWGSRFSRALTAGHVPPPMFETIFWGIKKVLKNLLFFTPRRQVTIEFTPAGPDFPYQASRLEMNRYLEKWYNRPDGILPQTGEEPGESLYLVSYSMWKEELPEIWQFL